MRLEKQVLNQLIDKYERSRHVFEAASSRRVILNAREIKLYQSGSYSDKQAVHLAVEDLRSRGFVDYQWVAFEEGNLLDKLFLNLGQLEAAYDFLGRMPLLRQLEEAGQALAALDSALPWVEAYQTEMLRCLSEERRFHRLLPQEPDKLGLLLDTFKGLGEISELTERIFSTRYLGNSKTFERSVRSRLVTILKAYLDPEMEEDQLLASVGIVRNYDELLLKGELSILLDGQWLDLSRFSYGTSLNSESIRRLEAIEVRSGTVLTIENKAVYYEYIKHAPEDEIVIYLGGFFGKYTRLFMEKLRDAASTSTVTIPMVTKPTTATVLTDSALTAKTSKKPQYRHWGDIDLGGFMIYDTLKVILGEGLTPLYMDLETLQNNADQAMDFGEDYAARLGGYIERNPETEFAEVIRYMLAHRVRLEQEALVVE
ncbi:Wadjet anti-phage system protein JetD domain-containing protein [Acidaminobacter hydrogenoformans]|uniref:Wadjet protein JetD C-terminal domain-containing protein n=1 Tax=Acidaminobacter hydrogenoformans DSM 2784 TaxID=1120920 RepID=A0A1G5S4C9_9FIRM|nr:Wadjet anti-phage system protein JetD domain-containing protein [Acidaminobacter hydrogenoformans]SCZ81028.1 hypothetical protein SAMN03080599_02570 [Acidaminobacter hydrogenoformans DSM 2784]